MYNNGNDYSEKQLHVTEKSGRLKKIPAFVSSVCNNGNGLGWMDVDELFSAPLDWAVRQRRRRLRRWSFAHGSD